MNWQASDAPWPTAQDALSAGPLLLQGGRVVLNPAREDFDTRTNIWRPTRQVAFGTLGVSRPSPIWSTAHPRPSQQLWPAPECRTPCVWTAAAAPPLTSPVVTGAWEAT
ncbi:hypothetical protein ACFSC4_08635 [Deinococcus malanensis]|uniref:hypothetical protein n=1 Tax=Deinococcus malanensis TaxID=1706855 RepID=UPI00362F1FC2